MNVTSEKTGPCEYTLTIEVEQDRAKKALEKTARQITRSAPIPGFRPGKAPYHIIESYFGKEVVYNRALEELGPAVYEDALKEAGLEPFAQGSLDMEEMEPLVLTAVVPVQPVIELGDYRAIRQEKPEIPFEEEDIDETIEELREQHATWQPVERPVQDGDQVTIDLVGLVGEEEEEVISQSSRRTVVMENMYPEGLYEGLLGLEVGSDVNYEIEFEADDPNPNFAGKTIDFWVTLHSVSEKSLPEVDADFAQAAASVESVEELRESIREKLFVSRREEARDELASNILLAVLEEANLEYPDVAIEQEITRQVRDMQMNLQGQGFSWETYLNMMNKSEAEYREEIRPTAEQRLREALVLSKIGELEDVPVQEDQVQEEIDRMIAPYGPQGQQLREFFATGQMREDIEQRIRISNTVEWLIDMATGELEAAKEQAEAAKEATASDTTQDSETEAAETEAPAAEADEAADADAADAADAEIADA